MSEINYTKSKTVVGYLYPALLTKDGKIIDGVHRTKADPNWPVRKTEIDSKDTEKYLLARAHANLGRRTIPESEKDEIVNGLAAAYTEIVSHETNEAVLSDPSKRIVIQRLYDALQGCMSDTTVWRHLYPKYLTNPRGMPVSKKPIIDRLKESAFIKKRYGEDAMEKVEAEVKKQTREELRKDPEFIREALELGVMAPEAPKPVVDHRGYHVPTVTRDQAEQIRDSVEKTQTEMAELTQTPKFQERARLMKAFDALGHILISLDSVYCPVDGASSDNLVWKCHPSINVAETYRLIKDRLGEA